METTLWIDREQSIWRVLPLHPQPQWLESLSSYILRLAEANGLKSTDDLAVLSGFSTWQSIQGTTDYSAISAERLTRIAHCSSKDLWNATFCHLAFHFSCSTYFLNALRCFLQGSIAASLRYCPHCLVESSYYRLGWRFLTIAGCYKHKCHFLNTCRHCNTPIPLFPPIPRVSTCATCLGDLRTCQTSLLPSQTLSGLERRTRDLELLLMPASWDPAITTALAQGSGFTFLRKRKHLSRGEVAHLIEREEQVIEEMEMGSWGKKATFADYWRYTQILKCSLSEVIEAAQIMKSSEQERRLKRLDEIALQVKVEDLSRSRAEWRQEASEITLPPRRKTAQMKKRIEQERRLKRLDEIVLQVKTEDLLSPKAPTRGK